MKKTPNIERRTSNVERNGRNERTMELPASGYAGKKNPVYDLEDRLLDFAVQIVELSEAVPNTRAGNHIAGQLLRSGTSPYGHHGEVESAESRKDFIHKLKVCLKELRETRRWLRLVLRVQTMRSLPRVDEALSESEELITIFVASVRTAERKSA